MHDITRRTVLTGLAAAAAAAPRRAFAAYPDRPITIVVPYLPGGSPDILARYIAIRMGRLLNTSIVVENKGGAAGTIGGQFVAQSEPDGYTLMLGTDTAVMTGAVKGIQYDGMKDLTPVGLLSTSPLCLAVGPGIDVKDFPALIETIRAKPGELAFASSGVGGIAHLVGELLKRDAGLDMTHVPYQGSSAAVQDVLAGRVPVIISGPTSLVTQPDIRILTTFSEKRVDTLSDVPIASEAGIDVKAVVFFGLYAPSPVPAETTAILHAALDQVVKDPSFKDEIAKFGQSPAEDTSAAYATELATGINANMIELFANL